MTSSWRDCIVTLMDLVDVKKVALKTPRAGSQLMRRVHRAVLGALRSDYESIARAYVWNDSILLLSFLRKDGSFEQTLRDADRLKRAIDQYGQSYAVAVKGRAFPPAAVGSDHVPSRATVIEASSYAMANCFEIERELRSLRKPWYVDGRIAARLSTVQGYKRKGVRLLPSGARRTVYVFDGYLWN